MNGFKIKTTHISAVREQQANQMDSVCALLDWSRERYCWHQFKEYESFCNKLAGYDPELNKRLQYSSVFRGFWNNEWAKRNATEFIPFANECSYEAQWIYDEYHFIHGADRLIRDEDFALMFEQIFKSI